MFKKLMYYVSKEEYLKILNHNLCTYEKQYEDVYAKFKIYDTLGYIKKEKDNKYWYGETRAGKTKQILQMIIDEMIKINDKITWIERCNINNINFDFSDNDEARNFLLYCESKNDVNLKMVENENL